MKTNTYFDGDVVSISFVRADGTDATNGVVQVGKFQFPTERKERIRVTDGHATINGIECHPGDVVDVAAGHEVLFWAHEPTCYVCTYH